MRRECDHLATRLGELANLQDLDAIYNHARETAKFMGFEYWHCGPVAPIIPNRTHYGVGFVPTKYWQTYVDENLKESDPLLKLILKVDRPFFVREFADSLLTDDNRGWVIARDAGIVDGLAVPVHGHNGYCAIVAWITDKIIELSAPEMDLMQLYSIELHQLIENYLGKAFRINEVPKPVSTSAMEIMEWVIQGKSNYEIGVILGISENTVKFHVKKAFAEFGVNSRIQAAFKCLF